MTIDEIVENGADLIEESTEKFLCYAYDKCNSYKDYTQIIDILNECLHIGADYTVYITGNRPTLEFQFSSNAESVIIPGNIKIFGDNTNTSVRRYKYLKKLYISEGVTSIQNSAASYCTSLEEVHIPDSVIEIQGWAFFGCNKLQSIKIPNSVQKIGNNAFSAGEDDALGDIITRSSNLKQISIPSKFRSKLQKIGIDINKTKVIYT